MPSDLKYHKYILKSAPYGQLPSVLNNLQKLSSFDTQSEQVQQILREYNQEHLSLIELDQQVNFSIYIPQKFFPIFSPSKDSSGYYVDQKSQKRYRINQLSRQVEETDDVQLQLPEPVIDLQENLSKKVQNYVETFFKESAGSQGTFSLNGIVFMEITQEGALNIHIAFTAKNVQLNNFYTGEWLSIWKINKEKIEGSVSVKSHFFESGNVQMNQNKNLQKQFEFTADMSDNASKIMKIIESFDNQIQKSLDTVYEEMSTGFFKHLRRIVPVTKTKMIWNVNALKMNQNLTQSSKK